MSPLRESIRLSTMYFMDTEKAGIHQIILILDFTSKDIFKAKLTKIRFSIISSIEMRPAYSPSHLRTRRRSRPKLSGLPSLAHTSRNSGRYQRALNDVQKYSLII